MRKILERCIDSILMQTNLTWNLILVDDESMDGNGNLCDSYAKKYSNITSIHKPNGGKSSVCNAGIDNSDDWVRSDLLEKLFSKKVKLM